MASGAPGRERGYRRNGPDRPCCLVGGRLDPRQLILTAVLSQTNGVQCPWRDRADAPALNVLNCRIGCAIVPLGVPGLNS